MARARGKQNRYQILRPPGEACCCIACGVGLTFSAETGLIFKEREEWKSLEGKHPAIVRAEDIESMYFQNKPGLWTSFARAILYNPKTGHHRVAGIAQNRMTSYFEPDPVPRDPRKARIGGSPEIPSQGFDRFLLVNLLQPELSDKNGLLGYHIHAHCWVLLDRVMGREFIEQKLSIFTKAVQQFWKENRDLWKHVEFDYNYEDPFYPVWNRLKETSQIVGQLRREDFLDVSELEDPPEEFEEDLTPYERMGLTIEDLTKFVNTSQNPVIVPEIQTLINQAVQGDTDENDDVLQQTTAASDIPVEIAMMIVNIIYNDIYHNRANITDLRNMLLAFQWKLPDSYWQGRCKKDLIFEVDDLIRSSSNKNDNSQTPKIGWQFLCLGIEELFLRDEWYDRGGLKNRGRTLQLLQGLKKTFLEMIEQEDDS